MLGVRIWLLRKAVWYSQENTLTDTDIQAHTQPYNHT